MIDIASKIPANISAEITGILKTSEWRLFRLSDSFTDKVGGHIYRIYLDNNTPNNGEIVSGWDIVPMIHCCGMAVSTNVLIYSKFRGKGLGAVLNKLRIHLATDLGYGCLMCTDIESNIPQRKILKKNGWKDVHSFVNPRTGNTVFVSVIDLEKKEK